MVKYLIVHTSRGPPHTDRALGVPELSTVDRQTDRREITIHSVCDYLSSEFYILWYLCLAFLLHGGQEIENPFIVDLIVAHLDFVRDLREGGREGGKEINKRKSYTLKARIGFIVYT